MGHEEGSGTMGSGNIKRRDFLRTSAGSLAGALAGTTLAAGKSRAAGANGRINIGIMGTGNRGRWLIKEDLVKRQNVEIACICDVDQSRVKSAVAEIQTASGRQPKVVKDFRAILDDKSIDVFFNVTPDHWHALPTIMACQAGKDVYLEKPASHNAWEGRKMVEAARKYKRIVQLGTQTRSGPYTLKALDFLRSGRIGEIHLVRIYDMKNREQVPPKPDSEPPAEVDYDMWLGAAPLRPFNTNHFHYNWHWFWDYSGGDIINDSVHQIDIARMFVGRDYPTKVFSTGGKLASEDATETPDTQLVTWEFDNKILMTFELALWTPHMQKLAWDVRDTDSFPAWQFDADKIEVHGTKGMMLFSRHGGGWQAWNPDWDEIANCPGRHPHGPHIDNFFDCVQTRRTPNADIEEGHHSTLLCQVANISYRLGGQKLEFDGKSETFPGNEKANAMLKRTYRDPWRVPEEV